MCANTGLVVPRTQPRNASKVFPFVVTLVVLFASVGLLHADFRAEIGYDRLERRLGTETPAGAQVAVTQVEGFMAENAYLPDANNTELASKTILPQRPNGLPSNHATTVARFFYGELTSIAPGIMTVDAYDVDTFLGTGLLRGGYPESPLTEVRSIQNHSWIGAFDEDPDASLDILRRLDHLIDRDAVVVVAAVNNARASDVPELLASAYNTIAVGLTSGESSLGPTGIDTTGRAKPDLVAPASQTSWATPIVASCAAVLMDAAQNEPNLADALRPEAVKAILLAGASKAPFDLDAATTDLHDDWTRSATRPLDFRYGAGQVDIDRSHQILVRGPQSPSPVATVSEIGWSLATITDASHHYYFTVPPGATGRTLSIALTWHRRIDPQDGQTFTEALAAPTLADINLRLANSYEFTPAGMIDESRSSIDNVEHIFQRSLPAGQYVIEVTSDAPAQYALAWYMSLKGDFDQDGDVDLADYLTELGCLLGPGQLIDDSCAQADLDGDGDVDLSDVVAFQALLTGAR